MTVVQLLVQRKAMLKYASRMAVLVVERTKRILTFQGSVCRFFMGAIIF
jgi:hypothetical protein